MHEELKARLLAWTKTSSSFGLDSIGKDIAAALEAIEQLERQLAERDAEIAKHRDAPVVAWMNTNGAFNHMKKAEQDSLQAEAMGKLTEMVRAAQKPQPDRVAELEQLRQQLADSRHERDICHAECIKLTNEYNSQLAAKDEVIAEAGEMLAMRDRQLAALKAENEVLHD